MIGMAINENLGFIFLSIIFIIKKPLINLNFVSCERSNSLNQ